VSWRLAHGLLNFIIAVAVPDYFVGVVAVVVDVMDDVDDVGDVTNADETGGAAVVMDATV
jgi:hypothetical protein